jgi:sterol desaturase/sphingolipid hydroxylase (fatty acid hydroxylase superfamily)
VGVVDIASLIVMAAAVLIAVFEFLCPARHFESVPHWRLKCILFMPLLIVIGSGGPMMVARLLPEWTLFPGARLGTAAGALLGIAASELVVYWMHRLHHRVAFLWRWVHQLHHSAECVDVYGAAYFHPLEVLEGAIVGMIFFSVVLGLNPEASGLAVLWQAFTGVFQHGNFNTPRWLGYLIQRPEQHCVHHERGVHDFNFANLPLWDLVFGTFQNPRTWQGEAGFYAGGSARLWAMIRGQDISSEA